MKICIVVDDYLPHSTRIAAKMMHELAIEIHRQGHEVTVVTPSENLKSKAETVVIDSINVLYFKNGKIKNTGKVRRVLNETLLSFNAWFSLKDYFKKNKNDLIVYYSPSIFWGGLISKLKKIWNAPSYLILRDSFPQWAVDQKLIKEHSLIEKYFRFFEKKNYSEADKIGLMSPRNLALQSPQLGTNKKLEVLYNWAQISIATPSNHYRKILKLEGKIVFIYGGTMGRPQDMLNLARLAKNMLAEPTAHFVFVGDGDEYEVVEHFIYKHKISNATLLPSKSQVEFNLMLSEFDVGLFTLHKDRSTHDFPGKILAYMMQGIPILGSINQNNDLKQIIEICGAGLISVNGEDDLLFANASKLLHDESYRKSMGISAHKLLRTTFSVESAAAKVINI